MRLRLWRLGERTAKSQETPWATHCFNTVLSVHDVLVALDLLDRIRIGFFHAVFIVRPAASWSRARHSEEPGQSPLRTHSQPFEDVQAAPAGVHRSSPQDVSLQAHPPMGASDHTFNTSADILLGTVFWRRIFAAIRSSAESLPVMAGEKHRTHSALSGSVYFSVASSSFSWSSVYRSWVSGELSLGQLREFFQGGRAGKFSSVCSRDDFWRFQRSAMPDHCRVTSSFGPGSSSSSSSCLPLAGLAASSSSPSVRTPSGPGVFGTRQTSTSTSSRLGCTSKSPPAAQQSRGTDGNGPSPVAPSAAGRPATEVTR